ncbi:hypothetical protein ACHMW9_17465 [Mesorhizobium terrae]
MLGDAGQAAPELAETVAALGKNSEDFDLPLAGKGAHRLDKLRIRGVAIRDPVRFLIVGRAHDCSLAAMGDL